MIEEYFMLVLICCLLFSVIGTIMMYVDKKRFCNDEDDSFYYGYSGKRKIFKKKSKVDKLSEVLITFSIALVIVIFGFGVGSIEGLRKYWNGTGVYVEEFCNVMFNMWIALMGVLVVFVTFIKKTWLTFTADDIVKRFRMKDDVVRMGVYILVSSILQFFKPIMFSRLEYQWYFGIRFLVVSIFIAFVWRFLKICYLIIESFFGNKMEQIFLDSLYEELWYGPVRGMDQEGNWKDDDTIKSYTDYLIEKYLVFSKRIELEKIHKIGFATNLYMEGKEDKEQRYKRIKIRSFLCLSGVVSFFVLLLFVIVSIAEVIKNKMSMLEWVGLGVLPIILVFVMIFVFGSIFESFAMFAIVMTNGRCSYELVYKEDSKGKIKRRFVREVAFFEKSNYFQYVHAMESLIAFYLIAPDKAKTTIFNELNKKCLYEINESKVCLPLIVLDYLNYIDNKEKSLLPYLIEIDDSDLIKRLIRAFCLDIGRRCYDCIEADGVNKFENYIEARGEKNKVYIKKA